MTPRLWAAVVSAAEADAAARSEVAAEIDRWIAAGGPGAALITCHRAEVYGFGAQPRIAGTRRLAGPAAVRHLFRVACGLESVIVGEDEVLHQVREALAKALRRGADPRLRRLLESAIATGRGARARRTESSGNLAQRAVEWLDRTSGIAGRRVVVAGAGRMGSALAHAATSAGAEVVVASRDAARAHRLARLYGGAGVDLEAGARLTRNAAGVGVALGGPWTELLGVQHSGLPPFADISAPSAVPAAVRHGLDGTFLGIDDLFTDHGPEIPGPYTSHAERLIETRAAEFTAWLERAG